MLDIAPKDSFRNGVHPPQHKDETAHLAIRQFPFAPLLIVPLSQHLGKPAKAVVREGQEVIRGQTIAQPDGFMSVAMHSPASGIVRKIALAPSISGNMVASVYIEPYPASTQEVSDGEPCDVETATADEIILAIQRAGIVGLGGAAFPTHVKLKPPEGKHLQTLFINGVECEPYLTTDHRVMLEQTDDIFMGIRYLLRATGTSSAVIAIEANKPDAAEKLKQCCPQGPAGQCSNVAGQIPPGCGKNGHPRIARPRDSFRRLAGRRQRGVLQRGNHR